MSTIEIHTSERELFKRCRLKWSWAGLTRGNLVPRDADSGAPWLGSGVHFALEDYHGYNRFDDPRLAFAAYVKAHKADELPSDSDKLAELGDGMLGYYVDYWLAAHPEPYKTLMVDGVPQVEVQVEIDITDLVLAEAKRQGRYEAIRQRMAIAASAAGEHSWTKCRIMYVCTFDRVCEDSHGRLLGLDYKTAKSFDHLGLSTNPQAAAYDWALALFYVEWDVEGIVWQQHFKAVPEPPEMLKRGKKMPAPDERLALFSVAEKQHTTYTLYRQELLDYYGDIPQYYIPFLNTLAEGSSEEGDRYVRRDILRRNDAQRAYTQASIVEEVVDMLDPGLPIYPNPTRDCSWDCVFKAAKLALEDGADPDFMLQSEFVKWAGYKDDWRGRIQWPRDRAKARR